jgi:phosphohistidine phosphatase
MDILAVAMEEAGGDEDARILLVGHNPGMHDLARFLCSKGDADQVARLQAKFPTGALAELDLSGPFGSMLQEHSARLLRFLRPKDLPNAGALKL